MPPQIAGWDDLTEVWEQCDGETGEIQQTSFALFDGNESFYYGMLETSKADITFEQVANTLKRVPDEEFYTRWPAPNTELIQAPATLTEGVHVKRPNPQLYKVMKEHDALSQLSAALLAEAEMLELLSQHPHPNIIRYYGCRVLRGYFIGLVMDKHPHDLYTYLKNQVGKIEKRSFIVALDSSLRHLHKHGLAHNDLTPYNILVSREGMPVLIDFAGCQPIGTHLKHIRGTKGWIDGETKDHNTSTKEHDGSALSKISAWLDKPVFDR
ncbi:hypothetical protein N7491_005592 [Penicillium cf. griseofulvum]|uniref:Protein kinase domain-containing protein n=1 Tax=Penicillium cf. griseofulvum TaxID=2972120 RepID=A0A9W9M596_9EURO|nr:hypothetical protein N7472_008278 [Penicillium cf. griseofulvum]KAJ5434997.1 hypothetical protein N7491_005592 [Penicillium cf. griseofulvum]KAJ5452831.1 hypothetical protein N7445_001014 [Penicillium cf. griseofulvum]